ncbi:MAG: Ig-like domain-containing protein, partial [Chloroflexales bacterium]|nr:Ig-like domain-containing protein [Chloroflexales bacterium]
LLAEATFVGESSSGWQEVTLASPVAVNANTTYVASYHMENYYALKGNFFTNCEDNPPLRALAKGESGPNGVYKAGASGFPDQTFNASNYWVDVVFNTTVGADTTPPTVSSVSPTVGATDVSTTEPLSVVFSEPLDPTTVSAATFELRDASNALVPATVSYSAATRTATLDPTSSLANTSSYTARIKGGANGVKDAAGNALAADYTWSFATADPPPPPPDEGPGGPILVVASAANPFGRYYAEILRAEGLNAFTVTDVSQVTATTLNSYDVVILGQMPLTGAQVTLFGNWVAGGGNLIAMRPDPQLAGLLGLSAPSGTLAEGYLLVNTSVAPGTGITDQTIQFHDIADRYTLNGATAIATLYANATTATANPAVTLRSVGSNGGQAAAFTFDLARSVVYTRQGNPAWAGQNRDAAITDGVIRSNDLFYGGAEPDWVNLSKVAIPQADEQQRLLVNLIGAMNADRKPLPRFWYFPRGEKAVVVMTHDDHGGGDIVGRINGYNQLSPASCNVDNWECVRSTTYLYTNSQISDSQVSAFQSQGHEFGVHVETGCGVWTPASLANSYATQLPAFQNAYPSAAPQRTHRTHCIAWSDWATQPKVELANDIRLDTNYYYWPAAWIQNRPGMFTGSGMPMRFADTDGTLIDVYQATTQLTDESGQSFPFNIDALLDKALGPQGYYGAFTTNIHTDGGSNASNNAAAIVASAQARGVPVVSARQMLTWLDGRNASSFAGIGWAGNTLSFSVNAASAARGLQAMVPAQNGSATLQSLTRGGTAVPFSVETIKGMPYALFAATDGAYAAQYDVDSTPPTVTATAPANGAGGVAANATVTAQFSEPIDPSTLN